ncbi:unnamed protein product [Pedinophyceae sp. YPF-701]|nr:unnamed protein product [Pedinophyceae sp. YPF-701]
MDMVAEVSRPRAPTLRGATRRARPLLGTPSPLARVPAPRARPMPPLRAKDAKKDAPPAKKKEKKPEPFDFARVASYATGAVMHASYGSPPSDPSKERRAGIVLHPTSLPGAYGCGDVGPGAFKFVDWLAKAGMTVWQVLPLVPPERLYWSPYTGEDGLCGNTLMISTEWLEEWGLLQEGEAPDPNTFLGKKHAGTMCGRVDFAAVAKVKDPLLDKAAQRLVDAAAPDYAGPKAIAELATEMQAWRAAEESWIEDSALFRVIADSVEGCVETEWFDWPKELRLREPAALEAVREKHAASIDRFVAKQFLFDKQWRRLRAYANEHGVSIIGDIPIYVGGHSADVWASQHLFELSADAKPLLVSGVPPDAFSDTGQLWGSPLFDWAAHEKEDFQWWTRRMRRAMALHDEVRIDHFRGFTGYWAVEATEETAMVGVWKRGPGSKLFQALERHLGKVPILAEDLGVITPDVHELRKEIDAPGMVVLQFAWGSDARNTHLPHNHYEDSFAYPGTHDNDTCQGWWDRIPEGSERDYFRTYLGVTGEDPAWDLIKSCMQSVSRTALFTLQDVMRLGNEEGRMNTPGVAEGNWSWTLTDRDAWSKLAKEAEDLRDLAITFDRAPWPEKAEDVPSNKKRVAAERAKAGAGGVGGKDVSDPIDAFCQDESNVSEGECRVYDN